jgi:dihydroorotate dehydrogenase
MLTLRGINYGGTFCAVGARGFAGEGYPFHRIWKWFGMTWEGTSFAGKTMTLLPRDGFMPLAADGVTPKEFFPSCIWGSLRNGGEMINNVGLSNFGADFYLGRKSWKKYFSSEPFMTSIMLMEETSEARKNELYMLSRRLKQWLSGLVYALQINIACPNTGHDLSTMQAEMRMLIRYAKELLPDVSIVANVNALMPISMLVDLAQEADALWIGNAIPFGSLYTGIDWGRFGTDGAGNPSSPLTRRNEKWKGGLSSPACFPLSLSALRQVRRAGVDKPIVVGNGIRTMDDLHRAKAYGANACFLGSVAVVRPWRMRGLIHYSNQLFN